MKKLFIITLLSLPLLITCGALAYFLLEMARALLVMSVVGNL